jgi:hypothetical protein
MTDVDVDRSRLAVVGAAPERLEQHPTAVDATRMPCERPEKLELDVGQLNRLIADFHRPSPEVDPEPVDGDHFLLVEPDALPRRGRAAEQRTHPASKLPDRERLRDVVVRPELEAEHLVELVVTGREHDDRHRALGP